MNSRMHKPFLTCTDVKQKQTVTQKQQPRLPKHLHIQPVPLPKQEKKSKAHPEACNKLHSESYSYGNCLAEVTPLEICDKRQKET